MKTKVMKLEEAIGLVKDGDAVATSMAGNIGNAGYLIKGLETRFLETGSPKGLTKYSGCGHPSDAMFAHPGFIKRFVGSHPGPCPPMLAMIDNNELEAYGLPQGIIQQLYRCTAAKQPGLLSKIGIGTYVDPRQVGGRLNDVSKDSTNQIMEVGGEEWIFYKSFPVDVALIRATTADESGNIAIEEEALKLEILEIALAAKASGGKVLVQVKNVVANGSLKAKDVVIPAEAVDAVVVVEDIQAYHMQTNRTYYNPFLSGQLRAPQGAVAPPPEVLDMAELIGRRAVYELYPGAVVNVGLGVGVGVCSVAATENMVDRVTFTLELGAFGGTPTPKSDFGATVNPTSFIAHPSMFDFYHGGGLDIAFLGSAEVDREGNVNVSRFGEIKAGRAQGGFIDISQSAKKVVFCTYLKAGGLKAEVAGGKIEIGQEGKEIKFVEKVNEITFNGKLAVERGQEVVYITERCVFKLTKEGVVLTEIAPGVDLEKDVLAQMAFKPVVSKDLKVMDARIYVPGRMGCFD
ncbi:MAG: acyl CoA:acetate/3-ketoacid CoA transferase [Clostridiales bacterium]|nr:acyl CoA:acetate/3-ketoacid CoA transferase [Clostridiales bacterium]